MNQHRHSDYDGDPPHVHLWDAQGRGLSWWEIASIALPWALVAWLAWKAVRG